MSIGSHHIARKRSLHARIIHRFRSAIWRRRNSSGIVPFPRLPLTQSPINIKLMHSLQTGRNDLAKELIAAGADVNFRYSRGRTALMAAIAAGNTGGIALLLSHGASIDATNDSCETGVMFARAPNVLMQLVQAGADLRRKDIKGQTVLMHAARGHDEAVVRILLRLGASPFDRSKAGQTAADMAREATSHSCAQVLDKAAEPWSEHNHHLFPRTFRVMVRTLLLVHVAWPRTHTDGIHNDGIQALGEIIEPAKETVGESYQDIPKELWMYILSFLHRDSWEQITLSSIETGEQHHNPSRVEHHTRCCLECEPLKK